MINVIMDQLPFCFPNGLLDGVKLLGNVETRTLRLDHLDDAAEVALCAPQTLDDFWMRLVNLGVSHAYTYPPGGDAVKRASSGCSPSALMRQIG